MSCYCVEQAIPLYLLWRCVTGRDDLLKEYRIVVQNQRARNSSISFD